MVNQQSYIEEPLLRLVIEGNQAAFTELFVKYSGLLYNFLYKHTDSPELTDDLVQDIFTKIWLIRESLTEVKHFHSFLFTMARNHALNEVKRHVRERQRNKKWSENQSEHDIESEEEKWQAQLDIIEQAIKQLPVQQQKAWLLSRQKGMKYSEIAEEMQLSRETVKKYIQYANARIMDFVISKLELALLFSFLHFF